MNNTKPIYAIKKVYMQVTNSIAFYPFLITICLLAFAWGTLYLDRISVGGYLINKVTFLKIDNADTARNLLSALLTGLISLVTFSFSMVMIVLTQIMSSFSPRLLPDLVSKRGNQIVMGIIVGTICYIVVVLSSVQTIPSGPKVPLLSVFLSMLLGIVSLFTFIYFIHKISNEVQIGNILNSIYRKTSNVLNREMHADSYHEDWKEEEDFYPVKAWDSGYFNTITKQDFIKQARKYGLKLRVLKEQGMYVLKGDPFLEINKPLNDDIKEILKQNIVLRHQELVKDNFLYGFKHLTEIAVKALSPAVNDPGTAINAIDYLSDLFRRLQQLRGQKVEKYDDGTACIIYKPVPFEQTLYICLSSIRAYSTEDVAVQARLIDLISKIGERDEQNRHRQLLQRELNSIEEASAKDMKSEEDIRHIKAMVKEARKEQSYHEYR